jgi:hypothetical protein
MEKKVITNQHKAHRLLDVTTNKVIIIRDMVIDRSAVIFQPRSDLNLFRHLLMVVVLRLKDSQVVW